MAPDPAHEQFERWYVWAGVPVGVTYDRADQMVSEAVSRLEAERDNLRRAVQEIVKVARAGDWEGPEIPDPVAAAIAHAELMLRHREPAWAGPHAAERPDA